MLERPSSAVVSSPRDCVHTDPAARGAGRGARPRAGGDGDLRRVGRSGAPQAAARALQPDARSPAAGALRDRRVRAPRGQRRGVPRGDARRLQRVRAPPPDRSRAVVRVRAQHLLPAGRATTTPRRSWRSSSGSRRSNGRSACPATASSIWRRRRPRSRRSIRSLGQAELAPKPPPPDAPKPLGAPPPFARVIIEKPFGTDLETARALNRDIHETLDERQIYRIDHYLGKETVQNLLVFRFANGIFEPVWNNRFVDHVQITGAETVGVEGARRLLRAGGQPARHGAEPPAAGAEPVRDGAAGRLRPGRGARRKAEGAQGVALHPCKRFRATRRARAVRRRLERRAGRAAATARSRTSARRRRPRRSWR